MIADQQWAARGAVGAAVAILLIHGVIGTALWFWLARETERGRRRARAWATAIFCIATVSGISVDAHAPSTGLTQAFSGIEWVIGLCAVILLWNRPSRSYYAAQRPAAIERPPVSHTPVAPSPSLRPRQAPSGQPNTRQDWPARPVARGLARPGPLRSQRPPRPAPAVGPRSGPGPGAGELVPAVPAGPPGAAMIAGCPRGAPAGKSVSEQRDRARVRGLLSSYIARGYGAVGSAPPWHGGGLGFESP